MDICANVQYNKVLEADPLELLEAGRGREMKANLKFASFSVRYSRRL